MNRALPILLLLGGLLVSITLTTHVHNIHKHHNNRAMGNLGNIPPEALRAMTLEFHGISADFLFLKAMTYVGMCIQEKRQPTKDEWRHAATMLRGITDLDPAFWDPYLFAEVMFPWQANMLPEANRLLIKAEKNRPWDYQPAYFLGFNAFFFEHNAAKAAPYLRSAATFKDAPGFIKGLAARFSLYGNQTKLGIIFLAELIKSTNNPQTRAYLSKRLRALQEIDYLTGKVKEFKKLQGRLPKHLNELVKAGIINSIPPDPYGGRFTIMPDGRVYTTSNLIEKK